MYLLENPVLQRELLVNLRMPRAFILLLAYQAVLCAVVFFAWPQSSHLDFSEKPESTTKLVDLFLLGQYILASLMAPSFASGTITGEKERKTYEMLLASPLRPEAIILGKAVASLTHLTILIFASLPIIMLCLALGGVSPLEVLAAYVMLMCSVFTFGMISISCSSFFHRTASSLVVSYLLILPLAICGAIFWYSLRDEGATRLQLTFTVLPAIVIALCTTLFYSTSARLLHPPDVGSEGKDVVDLDVEAQETVGLVIQRDQFPDRLFAPPKRMTLMDDNANPVYDKEIHSEIFSQGTLMLRVVIQVSMALAIPIMAWTLFINPHLSPWYVSYVVLFNLLVGPVFNSSSVTSERERETLDLLLTTTITPWQILWGKLVAGLRVSSVLTFFLLWPIVLACVMVTVYWSNLLAVAAYITIVCLTCLTTSMVALLCSSIFKKSVVSMMFSYLLIVGAFSIPVAVNFFAQEFFPTQAATKWIERAQYLSPFGIAREIPLETDYMDENNGVLNEKNLKPLKVAGYVVGPWFPFGVYFFSTLGINLVLLGLMVWMFNSRWRVSSSQTVDG